MICKSCGKSIADHAKYCPLCGQSTAVKGTSRRSKTPKKDRTTIALVITTVVLFIALLAFILFVLAQGHGKPSDNQRSLGSDSTTTEPPSKPESEPDPTTPEPSALTVPDSFLETDYPHLLDTLHKSSAGDFHTFSHDPDPESHLDHVHVEITEYHPHGSTIESINAVYQYYKDSDTWSLIQCESEDDQFQEVYDYESFIGIHRECSDTYLNYSASVDIIDADENSVTISYEIYHYYNYGDDSLEWIDTETFYWDSRHEIAIPCGYIQTIDGKEYERNRELEVCFNVDFVFCSIENLD